MDSLHVAIATPQDADALAAFAAQSPLVRADFASLAQLQPDEPRVLLARSGSDGPLEAAAIDDGLAMSVGGTTPGLLAIARSIEDLPQKLVIAGRTADVATFVSEIAEERTSRPEHFMAVARSQLRTPVEAIPLRIATADDLPILRAVRAAALAEEYGIPVEPGSRLLHELETAVARAVELQGVAIWVEDGRCAFTAQLIAKTPVASMFGDLYVDPQLRGSGRATRALTAFCTWLMTESEHVTLRVGCSNQAAVRLYERVGFTVVEEFCSSMGATTP